MKTEQAFHSGFIVLIGKPNVGKSTLLNRLVGQPISITANKPQTTRNQVRGLVNGENYQAVILDTPGIHLAKNELHRRIVSYAEQSISDADIVFYLTEPLRPGEKAVSEEDQRILATLSKSNSKAILLVNKIDQASPEQLLKTIELFNQEYSFQETFPISALKDKGIDELRDSFLKYLPEGIPYYPQDQVTDQPERVIVGEFIREQVYRQCFQEIPYGVAVMVDSFQESDSLLKIFSTVYVEKNSHVGIVIGKKGSMLKKIGQYSREKMERMLGIKIFLSLNVKVARNWRSNERKLSEFGYEDID